MGRGSAIYLRIRALGPSNPEQGSPIFVVAFGECLISKRTGLKIISPSACARSLLWRWGCMMRSRNDVWVRRAVLILLMVVACGCAKSHSFSGDAKISAAPENAGDGREDTPSAPPADFPINTQGRAFPELAFSAPLCQSGTVCAGTFQLSKAWEQPVKYRWRTDDALYAKAPPAGVVYAQPNVHYVPTAGLLMFAPGETQKLIGVQNIDSTLVSRYIGVVIWECSVGGEAVDCNKILKR